MAKDLNRHECIGRLGQDPEIKYLSDGKVVANLSVACSESWKDQQGQKQERTEWIRYVAFDRLAEVIRDYLKTGSKVYLSGKLRSRKWTDKSGQDRYTTEIVANEMQMLDSRGGVGGSGDNRSGNANQSQGVQGGAPSPQAATNQQSMVPACPDCGDKDPDCPTCQIPF